MVRSQSGAACSQGSMSARGSATTWAAARATRFSFRVMRSGKCAASDSVYGASRPSAAGRGTMIDMRISSDLQRGHVDPAPLLEALVGALDELHALGALDQRVLERGVLDDVADEHLPFRLETVLVDDIVRHFLPAVVKVDGLLLVGVPYRPRRGGARLDHA